MKKLLVRWLVIFSIAFCGIATAADNNELESSIGSCQGAFQVNSDNVTVKPLNSTICADDKFALLIYKTFPVAAEFIGGVFNLENHDLLVSKVLEMREEINYTVPLESVEASSVEIVGVFFKIAITMFVLHLIVKGFAAMQSGDSGDVIRYVAGASICALLTTSLSLGGRINPKGETTIASLPLVVLTFAGIGFANTVKSSSIYLMSQAGLERDLINGVEIAPPEQQAYAEVKELIEEAMCLDSVALAEVYLAADNERMAARRSILRGAVLEDLSFDSDGTTSRFEYNPDSNTINSGWRLSDEEHRKVCASRTLTTPSTNIDDLKSYIDDVASKVDVLNPSTEKITVAWDQVESQLDDGAEISEYLSAAQYLYSKILWRLGGGDVAVNEGSRALFNNRSSMAAEMAREIRAGECFADYVGYKNTEMTIKGMNSGSVGGAEWTLDCAIVRDGQLEMLFEADSSDAPSFAHQGLEAMSEHKYKAVELHAQLLDSFEAEEMVRSALRSVEARIQVEHAIAESKDEEFNRRAIMARTQGLLSFGNNAVRMLESWVDVSGALLKTEASVSSITSSVIKDSFYAGERGYLPSDVDLEFPERVMPSFIYYVPFQAENNAAVTEMVESQLGSQLDGGQGATASFMQKNSGLMYEEAGAPTTTTQTELLDESASSIIDDITTVALEINSAAGLSAGEVRRRAAEMCKTTATQSQIDELGISTGEYNSICARNSIMALTYYKNLGFKSVDHAASLAVVGAVSMGANKLTKIADSKKRDKGLANDGKITETASNPSLLSSVLPASGKAAAKINSMVAGLANTSFIQYIAGTLMALTLGLVVVTTVIYLLPSLLFTFAMTGLVSFTLIACAVSGVMACGWIIFGGDFSHLRKSVVGVGINLVIRPMMLVIALFLSVAIVQVADMMVTSIGTSILGNVSANLDFASSMMYRLIAAIVNLVFLLWLLRSSIIEVNRATDKLIELAGGSRTGDDSERALNVAIIASSSTISHQAQGVVNNATNKQR